MYPAVLSFESLLNKILDAFCNNQLVDIVTTVFWYSSDFIWGFWRETFMNLLFSLYIGMMNLIWVLEQSFDLFAGTGDVFISDQAGNVVGKADFMTALFTGSAIQNAYWYMMLAATVLCFFFTIIAIIRSMGDALGEMRRPLSTVLRQAFQAVLTFFMVPLSCLAVMKLGAAITKIVTSAGSVNGDQRIADVVFVLTVGDAFKSESARQICSTGRMFTSSSVRKYIDWDEMNYIYAFILGIFIIFLLITIVMQAVMRALMLVVLFLTSPWFVSAIPLDGGEKFKSWTRLFAGFSFATFGPILVMRVYCVLLVAVGITGDISFGSELGPVTEWILKMVITAFGMIGIWQSQYLLLDIFSPETSRLLRQSQFLAKMASDSAKTAANAAMTYATGGASKLGKVVGSAVANSGNGSSGGSGDNGGMGQ